VADDPGQLLEADILVLATPIWMGQPASVCKLVLERASTPN
jgi:multimeric flavodoxin WrbA